MSRRPCLAASLRALVAAVAVALFVGADPAAAQPAGPETKARASILPPELLGPGPAALGEDALRELLADAPAQDDPIVTVDACMATEMQAKGVPGGQVAIYRDGEIIYEQGYGVKHAREGGAVGPQTQFRIGSVTKMMTAAAVMQQVEAGKVDLHAPVTRYIPEFEMAGPGTSDLITVWNLLTHSSGYPDNALLSLDDLDGGRTDLALTEWVVERPDVERQAPPGTYWNYSNPNFVLAGLVAERASGVPYHTYMPTRVWARAGMTSTTLLPAEVLARGDYTYGHWAITETLLVEAPDSYDNWAVAPAGYAFSTAADLARWADLLMSGGGDVLTEASAQAMQAPQQFMDYTADQYYGFGIFRETYKGVDVLQHGGNIPGWSAMVMWVPEHRFAVAALDNAFPATLTGTPHCAIEAFLALVDVPPPVCNLEPATWGRFAGHYEGLDAAGTWLATTVTSTATTLGLVFDDIPDPRDPTRPYASPLIQTCGLAGALGDRTFAFDGNADGAPDDVITFLRDPDDPLVTWMRNRIFVGRRAPQVIYLPAALRAHAAP